MILHPSLQSLLTWLELPMELADCYRLLGLRPGASVGEIRGSYQRLTLDYNTGINEVDQGAKDKFIALTEAYKLLVSVVQKAQTDDEELGNSVGDDQETGEQERQAPEMVTRFSKATRNTPSLSEIEQQLKWRSHLQLQQFLKSKRFPRAIALVEGLAQRLPDDPEVRQWQAIAYSSWGSQLLNEKQLKKARIYLKKALKTDPHNRSLWFKVERDFRRMENIFGRECL